MNWINKFVKGDLVGVHFALNIFIATTILWLLVRTVADLDPIWAVSSMIAASDPIVEQAFRTLRGRMVNALLGCAVGLGFIMLGGAHYWTLPVALSVTVLLSTYVVRMQVMWRQAPITAALVISAGLERHSEWSGAEAGLKRVGEVLLGCVVGVSVSWLLSKIWPVKRSPSPGETAVKT